MENKNIKNINTLGLVCKIILIITEVALIIAIVGTIIGGIACLAMPKDYVTVSGSGSGEIVINEANIPGFVDKVIDDVIDIEETHFGFRNFGINVKLDIDEQPSDGKTTAYSVNAELNEMDSRALFVSAAGVCFISAILIAALLVAVIFGIRLAKTLQTCQSPFEEDVLKKMKAFVISLIPWAVLYFGVGNFSGLFVALLVIVIIMFAFIFKYGAQLQQESDETL